MQDYRSIVRERAPQTHIRHCEEKTQNQSVSGGGQKSEVGYETTNEHLEASYGPTAKP